MLYTRTITFRTRDGVQYVDAILEISLDRQTAVARAYKDASRTVALRPTAPLRIEPRSALYEADPVPVMKAVIESCIEDLADGDFVEAPVDGRLIWTRARFDGPKVGRWVGWTSRARWIVDTNVARLPDRAN